VDLLPGVRSRTIRTDRLTVHWLEHGPDDGIPVVLLHGNLSTGRFYEHLLPGLPDRYRCIAPDLRGFGRTEGLPIDATRGLRDWSDDVHSLVTALGIDRPVHLVGWSTAGAAISHYAVDHGGVGSLTYLDPVSPYGFGGVRADGTPCTPDFAGSGAGAANPAFVAGLRGGDRSASPVGIRSIMNGFYWRPDFRLPPEREDVLVDEVLLTRIGDGGDPGDAATSPNWPGVAPGTHGILNALSPKYCSWTDILDLDPKPPVLWTHGTADQVVSNASSFDLAVLGSAGILPGWPGADVMPPQPMVSQIREVLAAYEKAGGSVRTELFEGSGHGPLFDAEDAWREVFLTFLATHA
jgi:pimeloyl-ACP methyl ester carboxylesterase